MTHRRLLAVVALYWAAHLGVALAQGAYPIRPPARAAMVAR